LEVVMTAYCAELRMALLGCGLCLFLIASCQDLVFRAVPNAVPLGIALTGVSVRVLSASLLPGICAGVVVFVLSALCWRRGWLGGADVKLFGAGALLVPPGSSFAFVLLASLAGGCLAFSYWIAGNLVGRPGSRRPAGLLARAVRVERWRLRRRGPLPYAMAITAGAALTLRYVG
jgi:prepilin peptidase CpaA